MMKINQNYEFELNLKDLIFHILYKWRIILLFSLLFAGIFAFCEYWSFEKYHRVGELTPKEIQYEEQLEANQRTIKVLEETISGYNEKIASQRNYLETSILMKLDPMCIWTAEKKYYLNTDDERENRNTNFHSEDITARILTILSGSFSVDIDKDILIKVFGTDDRKDINEVASIIVNKGSKTISVVGCGTTKEEADERKEFVDSYLISASSKLKQKEKYDMEIISDNVSTKNTLTTRNAEGEFEEKDLVALQKEINDNINSLAAQRNPYIDSLERICSQELSKPTPKVLRQSSSGFILGFFLSFAVCAVQYLINGRLKTAQEMRNRYGLLLLGEFSHSRAWWKGKGIDWIIEFFEFGKKKKVPENELNNITYLINGNRDGTTILMTSTLEENKLQKVYNGLASRLQEKGINLVLQSNYLHNSEAVLAAQNMESVILVEEKYNSKIKDLNRVAEMLYIEESKVIGAVLI